MNTCASLPKSKLTPNKPEMGTTLLWAVSSLQMPAANQEANTQGFLPYYLIGAMGLVFIAILYVLIQRQKAQLNKLRVQLASDIHDDAGSLLAGIAMQAELLEFKLAGEAKDDLRKLSQQSRQAMANLRDIVWAVDVRKDNWSALLDRLGDYANEVLAYKGIAFRIKHEGINLKKDLPGETRKHLYLIAKEAIANVARHSNASEVCLTFRQEKGKLSVSIEDNGQPLTTKKEKTSGLGLSNIRMRAKALNAKLEIIKENGFGVRLQLAAL